MEPWYSPIQLITAMGVTIPFFLYYAWRVYNQILEHGHMIGQLKHPDWIAEILTDDWNRDELSAQLSLNLIFLKLDRGLGVLRRSLRSDVYTIIMIGFVGTLIGMIGSFTTLLMTMGPGGVEPASAITTLIRGGLSTALVTSLLAAVLAAVVTGYLSMTEKQTARLREDVVRECLAKYRGQASEPAEAANIKAEPKIQADAGNLGDCHAAIEMV